MNDRLNDVRRIAQKKSLNLDFLPEEDSYEDNDKELVEFIIKSQLAQTYITQINTLTAKMIEIKNEYHKAVDDAQKQLNGQINDAVEKFSFTQLKCKAIIDQIKEVISAAKEDDPPLTKPESRIKLNMSGCLIKDFSDSVERFQAKQAEIKQVMQKSTVRDAEVLLGRKLNEKETEEVIEDPGKVQEMYSRLIGAGHTKLKNAVQDIEDRHRDILRLEKSVNQVHQLFLDLAILVHAQGELIDNIEANILQARDYVFQGEEDIIQSKKNMESARKKKCCILIIVVVAILIIVFVVLGVKVF